MKKGFTLIELLIVVAIIAILAAIAVPNFLEAQTRAKVSRSVADMRSLVTALETYHIDTNKYPTFCGNGFLGMKRPYGSPDPGALFTIGYELSTPIAYITGIQSFLDPFRVNRRAFYEGTTAEGREHYNYVNHVLFTKLSPGQKFKIDRDGPWVLMGGGPDGFVNNGPNDKNDYKYNGSGVPVPLGLNYDATNGTLSAGDIVRCPKFNTRGWISETLN